MTSSRETAPRRIYCATWHLHRDPAVASDLCAGVFDHAGTRVALGVPPDWNAPLPSDEEWGIEWSKFYGGLDLAMAFSATGQRRPLDVWQDLVASWIDQDPQRFRSTDVTARRIQNWVTAWSGFACSPAFRGLRPGMAERLLDSLAAQLREVREGLTAERNHRTLELFSLALAAMALPELDPSGELLAFSVRELDRNVKTDILPDGVHRERSTHYHMVVLRNLLAFRENARRFGVPVPPGFDERVERACEFAMHLHRPDGTIPMLSDSDTGSYLELLDLAGRLFARPDFRFVATAGRQGAPPARRRESFPDGGYYTSRAPWTPAADGLSDDAYLLFDCGPIGDGGHGHYDALHVELYEGGLPLVVDPGRYTYQEGSPCWRHWFKGTRAHNTVTVDGRDQTPYRKGKPRLGAAEAVLTERASTGRIDMLRGEVRSPCYAATHSRRVFSIALGYWVIVDDLRSPETHSFDLRWHLPHGDPDTLAVDRDGATVVVSALGGTIQLWPAEDTRVEEGWVAPRYGVKEPAPVISSRTEGRVARFVTIVTGHRFRDARLESIVSGASISRLTVRAAKGVRHILLWAERPGAALDLGPASVSAGFAFAAVGPACAGGVVDWEIGGCKVVWRSGDAPSAFDRPTSVRLVLDAPDDFVEELR